MNKPPFLMGQTKQEEFAGAASPAPRPFNFAAQDFSIRGKNSRGPPSDSSGSSSSNRSKQSPSKNRSPPVCEQSGRPSTPYPDNEVQFVQNDNCVIPPQHPAGDVGAVGMDGNIGNVFSASNLVSASHQPMSQENAANFQVGAEHRRSYLTQQQSWPPYHMNLSQSPGSGELPARNPFVTAQRGVSYEAVMSHGASPPSLDREERVPNSTFRRSRVWKYGRRSSGGHGDRQPFTFSVPAGSQASLTGGARLYGKRTFSSSSDESWSTEPSHKQFISEERMMAEMHNLSIDGLPRTPLFPVPSSSPTSSHSSLSASTAENMPHAHNTRLPSTSSRCCGHGSGHSSDLFRFHQCNQEPSSRTYAEAVLADIERRLDDSDDEGVEEDMPPSQADGQQRLEMTPQLVSALKAKGSVNHVLPEDIVKKIAMSPCMELVLWRPPFSVINPRGGGVQDATSQSPQSSPGSLGSELPPIMEVEVEREEPDLSDAVRISLPPDVYDRPPAPVGMQEEALPDFDEDMDL